MRKLLSLVAVVAATVALPGVAQAALPSEAIAGGRPLTAVLSGANEVNPTTGALGAGDADAAGQATVTVDTRTGRVCYDLTINGLDEPASAAHIHEAPAGQNGPIRIGFDTPSPAGTVSNCTTVTDDALLTRLVTNPAGFYVNVHTATLFPGGAARGQLSTGTPVLATTLTGTSEVTAAGTSRQGDPDGVGQAIVTIRPDAPDPAQDLVCVELTTLRIGTATAAHIHHAASTTTGPVVVPLPTPDPTTGTVVGCVGAATALATDIATNPGDYYVNVHTAAFPDGAIRGQLTVSGGGYRMLSASGQVKAFGDEDIVRISTIDPGGSIRLTAAAVDLESTPTMGGYWITTADGGVVAFGDAAFLGNAIGSSISPFVAMATTPTGAGYWLVTATGAVFPFGDATTHGSLAGIPLNQPIVGAAATPSGNGYWLVASDGGVFSFGDAVFFGSTGAIRLNQPIVGIAPTPLGQGYWLVASDGGIFSFGDANFLGSTGAMTLNQPVVGMSSTATGDGYVLVAADGGVFNFGDSTYKGALSTPPVVAIAR